MPSAGARSFLCTLLAVIALGLALVIASSTTRTRQIELATWAELEKSLQETDFTISALETLERCEQLGEIIGAADLGFLEEMACQTKYPMVRIAGFYAIQKRFPAHSWRTALGILLRTETPGSLLNAPMLMEINKPRSGEEFRKMLDWLVTMPVLRPDALSVLMGALDGDALYRWYHAPPADVGSASMEAAIIDRLIEECQKLRREPSSRMLTRLKEVGASPGRPRFIYVMDAKIMGAQNYDPEFVRALISVMEDPDLKSISICLLCRQHFDFIESNIDLKDLVITDERRQVIKEALDTTRRLRQSSNPETSDRKVDR